jgi:hypothetical protein
LALLLWQAVYASQVRIAVTASMTEWMGQIQEAFRH